MDRAWTATVEGKGIPMPVRRQEGEPASLAEVDLDGSPKAIDIFADHVAMLPIRRSRRNSNQSPTFPLRVAMEFGRIFAGVVVQCSERALGVHVGMRRTRMRFYVHV